MVCARAGSYDDYHSDVVINYVMILNTPAGFTCEDFFGKPYKFITIAES